MNTRILIPVAICCAFAIACQEPKSPPVLHANVLPDSAEQMAFGVRFLLTDAGVRHGEVMADTALTYDENTRTELKQVRTTFFTAEGVKNAVLTSLAGTYRMRTGDMEARGNVVVVSEDGRKLETPQLRYNSARNEISSDSAFTMTESDRVVEGIGFVSDPDMNHMRILRGAKASGQPVRIPKP